MQTAVELTPQWLQVTTKSMPIKGIAGTTQLNNPESLGKLAATMGRVQRDGGAKLPSSRQERAEVTLCTGESTRERAKPAH